MLMWPSTCNRPSQLFSTSEATGGPQGILQWAAEAAERSLLFIREMKHKTAANLQKSQ